MQDKDRIVAVGLLTSADLALLGTSFNRLWPVEETLCFEALLTAIDDADREFRASEDDEATRETR